MGALYRAGFVKLRQEGSHARLQGPGGQLVTVKRSRDILKPKTLASALRRAGWTFEDLRKNGGSATGAGERTVAESTATIGMSDLRAIGGYPQYLAGEALGMKVFNRPGLSLRRTCRLRVSIRPTGRLRRLR